MEIHRHKTKSVKIGSLKIGARHPIAIQSMAKAKTSEIARVVKQIKELELSGCEILRLAVKDAQDALAIRKIKNSVKLPLVADIHFDYRLALMAIDSGVDKIRLNPGNIYKTNEVREVVAALKAARIPLRVGANSGSVRASHKGAHMPEELVKSALAYIRMIEKMKFNDIVVSLKASNVMDTVDAYRRIAKVSEYPLHLGVTATGSSFAGAIKSSIAVGALLLDGIGDTLRISLTDKPEKEVQAGKIILESLNLRRFGPEIISCPTCGRCEVSLAKVVNELEQRLHSFDSKGSSRAVKVAVMGCVVNGPGEAKEADLGVAFGKKDGLLFKAGKPVKKISFNECVPVLLKEIRKAYV